MIISLYLVVSSSRLLVTVAWKAKGGGHGGHKEYWKQYPKGVSENEKSV
jgi:hypothetical protein